MTNLHNKTYKHLTVPKNDSKVEVCVNEKKTIQQCLGMLMAPESTFQKIVTPMGVQKMDSKKAINKG